MNEEILFVNFNQDATALAVGSERGYYLYNLNKVDELTNLQENDDKFNLSSLTAIEDVFIVEGLFSSSLVALVSLSTPKKLKVCDFQKKQEICHKIYPTSILAVRLNRLRLVVCLEEGLYIYDIQDMKLLQTIKHRAPNPTGICELCYDDISYLAYPGPVQCGKVEIFDGYNLRATATAFLVSGTMLLTALKFNNDGSKLATAFEYVENGINCVKVFAMPSAKNLFICHRFFAVIFSLAFSADSMFLCCTSNTETLVFKLGQYKGWLRLVFDSFFPELPFAHAKLPVKPRMCAFTILKQNLRLLVASLEGYLYVYDVNKDEGGECVLIKQHKFLIYSVVSSDSVPVSPTAFPVASPEKSFVTAVSLQQDLLQYRKPTLSQTPKNSTEYRQQNISHMDAVNIRRYASTMNQVEETAAPKVDITSTRWDSLYRKNTDLTENERIYEGLRNVFKHFPLFDVEVYIDDHDIHLIPSEIAIVRRGEYLQSKQNALSIILANKGRSCVESFYKAVAKSSEPVSSALKLEFNF